MTDQKKLIILIVVASSVTSFLGGFLLTQAGKDRAGILQEQRGTLIDRFDGLVSKSTPTPLPLGLLQATDEAVLSPTNSTGQNTVLYYHRNTGYVSEIDLETRTSSFVSTAELPRLSDVVWSPDKKRVITVSRDSNDLVYKYFDYSTRDNGVLGRDISSVAFSPDNRQIVVVRKLFNENLIQVADFDGKNSRTVFKTRLKNVRVYWPNEDRLYFSAADADTGRTSLYGLGLEGELSLLIPSADNLSLVFSPSGSKILYSNLEDTEQLKVLDIASKNIHDLGIEATASSCDWKTNNQNVVCASRTGGETSIVDIEVASGKTNLLFSGLIITPWEVFLSSLENFLIISSSADNSLWAVKLK